MKSKFIVENQTGAPLEIKQRDTPDLEEGSRQEDRCARMLLHEQRHAGPISSSILKTLRNRKKNAFTRVVLERLVLATDFANSRVSCWNTCSCSTRVWVGRAVNLLEASSVGMEACSMHGDSADVVGYQLIRSQEGETPDMRQSSALVVGPWEGAMFAGR